MILKHAFRIVFSLLIGAAASVLVAWGIEHRYDESRCTPTTEWKTRVNANAWPVEPGDLQDWIQEVPFNNELLVGNLRMCCGVHVTRHTDRICLLEDVQVGWPASCLHHYQVSMVGSNCAMNGTPSVSGAWQLHRTATLASNEREPTYSYLPLWLGLAANTAFYGAAAYGLLIGFGTFRRWRVRRAGLCVGCGYSLRGLGVGAPCPECGQLPRGGRTGRGCVLLVRALICGALGAAVSVLVAWGIEYRRNPGSDGTIEYVGDKMFSGTWPRELQYCPGWFKGKATDHDIEVYVERIHSGLAIVSYSGLYSDALHVLDDVRVGWPVRCMHHCEFSFSSAISTLRYTPPALYGAWKPGLKTVDYLGMPYEVPLPVLPIWLGLAVNTTFYGAAAYGLLIGFGTFRRWRVRRAGLCVGCGYSLRGLGVDAACPECGLAQKTSLLR